MSTRPKVKKLKNAGNACERIVRFSDRKLKISGLVSFWRQGDRLTIQVYGHDPADPVDVVDRHCRARLKASKYTVDQATRTIQPALPELSDDLKAVDAIDRCVRDILCRLDEPVLADEIMAVLVEIETRLAAVAVITGKLLHGK